MRITRYKYYKWLLIYKMLDFNKRLKCFIYFQKRAFMILSYKEDSIKISKNYSLRGNIYRKTETIERKNYYG